MPLPQAVRWVNRVLEHHVQVSAVDDGNTGLMPPIEVLDIGPQDLDRLDRPPADDDLQPGKSGAGFS